MILSSLRKLAKTIKNKKRELGKQALFLCGGGHGTRTEIAVAETLAMKGGKPLRQASVPKIVLKINL